MTGEERPSKDKMIDVIFFDPDYELSLTYFHWVSSFDENLLYKIYVGIVSLGSKPSQHEMLDVIRKHVIGRRDT